MIIEVSRDDLLYLYKKAKKEDCTVRLEFVKYENKYKSKMVDIRDARTGKHVLTTTGD